MSLAGKKKIYNDLDLPKDKQEVGTLFDRRDLVGRLITQFFPSMGERFDRLAEPFLIFKR